MNINDSGMISGSGTVLGNAGVIATVGSGSRGDRKK